MSKRFRFFLLSILLLSFSIFGGSASDEVSRDLGFTVDHIIPEFCAYDDVDQEFITNGRTLPKVSKKLIFLDHFYLDFVKIDFLRTSCFLYSERPKLLLGVHAFLHLLQLY